MESEVSGEEGVWESVHWLLDGLRFFGERDLKTLRRAAVCILVNANVKDQECGGWELRCARTG